MPLFGIAVFYYGLITEKTILSKILRSKILVLLGKSSYIFYLIHVGIIATFLHKYVSNNMIVFVACNVISIVMFKYIEEPLNNFIRQKFTRNDKQPELSQLATVEVMN